MRNRVYRALKTAVLCVASGYGWSAPLHAAAPGDPYAVIQGMPQPPVTVDAARGATRLSSAVAPAVLTAPAYADLKAAINAKARELSVPRGVGGGIDMARASSDPAYAQEIQEKLAAMTMAEKMAFVKQMSAAAAPSASNPAVSAFLGGQRMADQSTQRRMIDLLQGPMKVASEQHKAADAQLNAEAKQCPTDKTGWPMQECTRRLTERSITEHRAIENRALPIEDKAFADALALTNFEVNKGKSLFVQAQGRGDPTVAPLGAWVLTYAQILADFGEAITLRAGFWAHANTPKYNGSLSVYVDDPDLGVTWPLRGPPAALTGF